MNVSVIKIIEIEKLLNSWFAQRGFEINFIYGQEFVADCNTNTVYFPLGRTETQQDKVFDLMCYALCPQIKPFANDWMLSLFHEVGHIETDTWAQEEWEEYANFTENVDYSLKEYFYHPMEIEATLWGCEYIKTHRTEIENLTQLISYLLT